MKKYIPFLLVLGVIVLLGAESVRAEGGGLSADVDGGIRAVPAIKGRVQTIKINAEGKVELQGDATSTDHGEEMNARAEMRAETVAEIKANAKIRMEKIKKEKKAKLDTKKKTRVETAARVSLRVLTDALARVQDLAMRVETRIDAAETSGVAVADARARLAEATTLWATAKTQVDGLEVDLTAVLDSQTPIKTFETFRTHAGTARDSIKAAHAKVVEAIAALKLGILGTSATTTVEVEASSSSSESH